MGSEMCIRDRTEGEQEEMKDFGEEKDQPWLVDSSQVLQIVDRQGMAHWVKNVVLGSSEPH